MGFFVFLIGVGVAIEAHSTAPGIYVGAAMVIAGALVHAIEESS